MNKDCLQGKTLVTFFEIRLTFFIPPNLLKTWIVYIYDSSDDHCSMIIHHSSERTRHNPICLFFTI